MGKFSITDILYSKEKSAKEFDFDNMIAPPVSFFLGPYEVEELRRIATSVKLSSKIKVKYQMIDKILKNKGFKHLAKGTNRVCYYHTEFPNICIKVAVDKVGMGDNPAEFWNQQYLKPFCTKIFDVSPCGTVAIVERVVPITHIEEFASVAGDIYDIIVNKILGEYVIDDIGSLYFMNWGFRMGSILTLLDFPYLYKLDGNKIFCNLKNPHDGTICGGEIDYDDGFNNLVCTKCGKRFFASELKDDSNENFTINKKGADLKMKVMVMQGDKIIKTSNMGTEAIQQPKEVTLRKEAKGFQFKVKIVGGIQDNEFTRNKELFEEPKTEPSNTYEQVVQNKPLSSIESLINERIASRKSQADHWIDSITGGVKGAVQEDETKVVEDVIKPEVSETRTIKPIKGLQGLRSVQDMVKEQEETKQMKVKSTLTVKDSEGETLYEKENVIPVNPESLNGTFGVKEESKQMKVKIAEPEEPNNYSTEYKPLSQISQEELNKMIKPSEGYIVEDVILPGGIDYHKDSPNIIVKLKPSEDKGSISLQTLKASRDAKKQLEAEKQTVVEEPIIEEEIKNPKEIIKEMQKTEPVSTEYEELISKFGLTDDDFEETTDDDKEEPKDPIEEKYGYMSGEQENFEKIQKSNKYDSQY